MAGRRAKHSNPPPALVSVTPASDATLRSKEPSEGLPTTHSMLRERLLCAQDAADHGSSESLSWSPREVMTSAAEARMIALLDRAVA
jgi:hypothetical protein